VRWGIGSDQKVLRVRREKRTEEHEGELDVRLGHRLEGRNYLRRVANDVDVQQSQADKDCPVAMEYVLNKIACSNRYLTLLVHGQAPKSGEICVYREV
jgi:hypothetical protein